MCVNDKAKHVLTFVSTYIHTSSALLTCIPCLVVDYFKAQALAADTDIHAVGGLLKKYFRELPEPLFTTKYYTSFIQGYSEWQTG